MNMHEVKEQELPALTRLWNQIVADGAYFPEETPFTKEQAKTFFAAQQHTIVCAGPRDQLLGFYILHPNGPGRRNHIANASYGVAADARGNGVGRALVTHSLNTAKKAGYHGLQFNAVVATNLSAIHLYFSLGFTCIGCIPGGYRQKALGYTDMYIFYYDLSTQK